jgi:hypothetical protein
MPTVDAMPAPVLATTIAARPRFRGTQVLVEVCREAMYGLVRNRFRAGLAMLGISWGIVSVVMLLAYGNGFRDALAAGFANAFGSGVVISWPARRACRREASARVTACASPWRTRFSSPGCRWSRR